MIKAPVRYFGGKYNMLKKLMQYYPKEYEVFVDVFGGSGVVALNNEAPIRIYNDLDKNVYTLMSVLQSPDLFQVFKERCDLTVFDETTAKKYRQIFDLGVADGLSFIERAYAFWYVNRVYRSGGTGGLSINLIKRRGVSKSVADLLASVDGLENIHHNLQSMVVLNRDGIDLINQYKRWGNTFMYLDPPYMQSTRKSDTRYAIDQDDAFHERLVETVSDAKCKVMLSGYDNPVYDKLGWEKIEIPVNTVDGANKAKTSIECIWRNYGVAVEDCITN